jgi:hypothetical protein
MKIGLIPPIKPDETLSSILIQLAHNHVSTVGELTALVWPGHSFWNRDLDTTASDELIREISTSTSLPEQQVREATVASLVKAMGFEVRRNGVQPGILPVGMYHRIRRGFGQQYCPNCLGKAPRYLRKTWRVSTIVACVEHQILLRDCCPHCGAPFVPHREMSLLTGQCHQCGRSLCDTAGESCIGDRLASLQREIHERLVRPADRADASLEASSLEQEAHGFHYSTLPTPDFMDGLIRLCRIATSASEGGKRSRRWRRDWERERVQARTAIVATIAGWLAEWPDRFLVWARHHEFSQHYLSTNFGPLPDWISGALTPLPYSFGPTLVRRRRRSVSFRTLRRNTESIKAYREARAKILLRRAFRCLERST